MDGAVTLVGQMSANGVQPSAETYHILIDVCVAASDVERAISVRFILFIINQLLIYLLQLLTSYAGAVRDGEQQFTTNLSNVC